MEDVLRRGGEDAAWPPGPPAAVPGLVWVAQEWGEQGLGWRRPSVNEVGLGYFVV